MGLRERGSYLHFATSDAYNEGMNNIGMTINYKGNVGIGTDEPENELEVCGTIKSKEWIVYSR